MHSVGFIGLGNVGGKLAGSLLRNKCDVMVRDLDRDVAAPFLEAGAKWADCPVSGGCHRAATGNIAIFAGCDRPVFGRLLPVLTILGRRVLHTGPIGTASVLKVMTNYLATANLISLSEALATSKMAGMDLNTTYEVIPKS
jgi:3-hydroxyisobutyrate dehydrogenase